MTEEAKQSIKEKGLSWFFLGFGIAAMILLNSGAGMAGFLHDSESGFISTSQTENLSTIAAPVGERIILARRGNRSSDESGEKSNGGGQWEQEGWLWVGRRERNGRPAAGWFWKRERKRERLGIWKL